MPPKQNVWDAAAALRLRIAAALPAGTITPEHTEDGHFYRINLQGVFGGGILLPSVTGALQMLKDESLSIWKTNRALDHVYANAKRFSSSDAEALAVLTEAKKEPVRIFEDAGDIGTRIHAMREAYFAAVMKGNDTMDPAVYATEPTTGVQDIRAVSAMRALSAFTKEYDYVPVCSELMVYDLRLGIAGTLDDIGYIKMPGKRGHDLCLLDVKTSNSVRDSYAVQVALYTRMFTRIVGVKPKRVLILRLSKEDGRYEVEEIPVVKIPAVIRASEKIVHAWRAFEEIKEMRATLRAKKKLVL